MLLWWRRWQNFSGCRHGRWSCRLILCPLGLKSVHLRNKVADVSSGRLVGIARLSPRMGKLMLGTMGSSTNSARGLATRMARGKGGQLFIRI